MLRKIGNEISPLSGDQIPKILLTKPPGSNRPELGSSGPLGNSPAVVKILRDSGPVKSKVSLEQLKLLNESWEFCGDRLMQFMTENSDFTVVGVLGAPGVGKSTILNELYGCDETSGSMIPPFPVQGEEAHLAARTATVGIDVRISPERLILLDSQAVRSAALLADIVRPDGTSAAAGDAMVAEAALEVLALQLGVFLCSVCHLVLIVSEGLHDISTWRLFQQIMTMKRGFPDPSKIAAGVKTAPGVPQGKLPVFPADSSKEQVAPRDGAQAAESPPEYFPDVIFVHTRLGDGECGAAAMDHLGLALEAFFPAPPFRQVAGFHLAALNGRPQAAAGDASRSKQRGERKRRGYLVGASTIAPGLTAKQALDSVVHEHGSLGSSTLLAGEVGAGKQLGRDVDGQKETAIADVTRAKGDEQVEPPERAVVLRGVNFWGLPMKGTPDSARWLHESCYVALHGLRDKVLGMQKQPFACQLSEKDWLRSSGRLWELVRGARHIVNHGHKWRPGGIKP